MDESQLGSVQSPRDAAVSFEATKYAARQNRDGVVVSLLIHPNDVPQELFSAPIGGRYFVAMVEIGDDEQAVVPENRIVGERMVRSAGMLCRDQSFQEWVAKRTGTPFVANDRRMESLAADFIRRKCGIASRAELAQSKMGQAIFRSIREAFERGVWI